MKRLAIVTTHPIQYNAPFFRLLGQRGRIAMKVFYTWSQSAEMNIYDPGFGINKAWDIPLLEGYDHHFSENISAEPGSHHYKGIINPNLNTEISAYKPDAVLVYGWNFKSHLKLMRYFKRKVPVWFRGDSTLLNNTSAPFYKKALRSVFLKWVYKNVDTAFFTGKYNHAYYKAAGLREDQLIFMPHAVDNQRFGNADTADVAAYKQALGLTNNDIVFVFAGKLEDNKDPFTLTEAFLQLNESTAHLVLVGNGPYEQSLKQRYANNERLHFLPFQNQSLMPAIYSLGDVFVLPSQSETWGLAVNEAMAAGRAVAVSNKCGCSTDLINEGVNGYIFKCGDVADLSSKLQQLVLAGKEGLKKMGDRSKDIIANWSYEKCADVIESKLQSL